MNPAPIMEILDTVEDMSHEVFVRYQWNIIEELEKSTVYDSQICSELLETVEYSENSQEFKADTANKIISKIGLQDMKPFIEAAEDIYISAWESTEIPEYENILIEFKEYGSKELQELEYTAKTELEGSAENLVIKNGLISAIEKSDSGQEFRENYLQTYTDLKSKPGSDEEILNRFLSELMEEK